MVEPQDRACRCGEGLSLHDPESARCTLESCGCQAYMPQISDEEKVVFDRIHHQLSLAAGLVAAGEGLADLQAELKQLAEDQELTEYLRETADLGLRQVEWLSRLARQQSGRRQNRKPGRGPRPAGERPQQQPAQDQAARSPEQLGRRSRRRRGRSRQRPAA